MKEDLRINEYLVSEMDKLFHNIVDEINSQLYDDIPKIVITKQKTIEPTSEDLSYYINKEGTHQVKIQYSYQAVLGDKVVRKDVAELAVPTLIGGVFIYNGKIKLPLNRVTTDTRCQIGQDRVFLSKSRVISSGSRFQYKDSEGKLIKTKSVDGLPEDLLKLDDYEVDKLEILTNVDIKDNLISNELIAGVAKAFKDNHNLRDLAINKVIISAPSAIIMSIRVQRYLIRREMLSKYTHLQKNAKSRSLKLFMTSISNIINNFFTKGDKYFSNIQSIQATNPLTLESMKHKVILEDNSAKTNRYIKYSRYDKSFRGIIDPVMTPDNTNASRVNELTRAVSITDGVTKIKVLDKDFHEIELTFLKYLNSKVLSSEEVDYDFNIIDPKDKYKVRYRGDVIESKDYDYIDPHPDYRLNKATAMIPMLNMNDSIRAAMAAKMFNQSIAIIGSEPRKVRSGNENLADSAMITKSPISGVVVDKDQDGITIREGSGNERFIPTPKVSKANYGTNILTHWTKEVGDYIHEGQALAVPNNIDDDFNLQLGINAKVAMMSFRGYTYEDGVVISQSMAHKMAHVWTETVVIDILPNMLIDGLVTIGNLYQVGDSLISGSVLKSYGKYSTEFLRDMGMKSKYTRPWSYKIQGRNITETLVYDIKIAKGDLEANEITDDTFSPNGRARTADINILLGNKSATGFNYDSVNLSLLKDFKANPETSYTVKIKLIHLSDAQLGDKIVNSYASKGVITKILPDDEMPHTEDGRYADIVMNPHAVISRKNIGQSYEMLLNKIAKALIIKHKGLMQSSDLNSVRDDLRYFMLPEYWKMDDEDLISFISTHDQYIYTTGSYSKINSPKIIQWMDKLGISEGEVMYLGRRKIANPILFSEMYMMKLYMLSDAVAKVTEVKVPDIKNLVLNQGQTTQGSRIGNMEMDAIQSNGITDIIRNAKDNDYMGAGWMMANAILSGLFINLDD